MDELNNIAKALVIPTHSDSFDSLHGYTGEEVAYFLGDGGCVIFAITPPSF